MAPLISIITPVYNNTKYILACVESVRNQSFCDYEHIIVDDGSTDDTGEFVDRLAAADERIRVIHQENKWIYGAFNTGINAALGAYFYILNSDDMLAPGALHRMSDIIETYAPDVIWTYVVDRLCDMEQRVIRDDCYNVHSRMLPYSFLTREELHRHWAELYAAKLTINQANLYKTSIARQVMFREKWYGSDTIFNIDIAPYIENSYIMSEPAYLFTLFNVPGKNTSRGKYYDYEAEMFAYIHTEHKGLLEKWGVWDEGAMASWLKQVFTHTTFQMRNLNLPGCKLSVSQKLGRVFCECINQDVTAVAEELGQREQLEARILSGVREILLNHMYDDCGEYKFAYDMLSILCSYEKTDEDMMILKNAVYNKNNPYQIGRYYLERLGR